MTIHDRFEDQVGLARTYAQDGAFLTAGSILATLGTELTAHGERCNAELQAAMKSGGGA